MPEPQHASRLSPAARTGIAVLCVAAGLVPILAAFDIGPLHRGDINGPPWLGIVAGGIFVAAGLAVAAGGGPTWLSGVLVVLILGGFAAIGHWIAFGPGERACSGTLSLPGAAMGWDPGDLECRIAFGLGAFLLDAFILFALASLLQKALGGPPRLAWLVTITRGMVVLVLAPFLILVLALTALRGGFDSVRARLGRRRRGGSGAQE